MTATIATPRKGNERLATVLEFMAMAILLAIVVARPFLGEIPYRSVPLSAMTAGNSGNAQTHGDNTELARVTFALGLLSAFACWMLAGAARGRLTVRFAWLGVLIKAFAIITFLSALWAGDKRAALDSWIEQVSLLTAAFLAAQLFADRKRFVLLLIILSAVGATLATKAYWQYLVEVPERISQFRENGDEQLRLAGIAPGTPNAQAFTGRALERTALGFGGLANVFASMLIVLAAAAIGLAGAKLSAALSTLAAWKARRQAGEIYLPLMAAILSIALAAAGAGALFLTGSRAGMVLGAAAFLAGGVIYIFRNRLAQRWKRNIGIAAAGVVLCLAGITAYGVKYDSLPAKSLTFRWHYWTASAEIALQHPLLGVGPGNFPDAYLQARRPAAEESVKMPHNVLAHAFSEYGIPGGTLFIAIIAGMLVAMCRPKKAIANRESRIANLTAEETTTAKPLKSRDRKGADTPTGEQFKTKIGNQPKNRTLLGSKHDLNDNKNIKIGLSILLLLITLISVPLARLLFGGIAFDAGSIFLEVSLPMFALAAAMVAWSWFGRLPLQGADVPLTIARVALGCGVAAFALHNLTEFGLFTPGPAGVFWLAGGALLAQAGGTSRDVRTPLLPAAAIATVIGVILAIAVLWYPVAEKTAYADEMAGQLSQGLYADAAASAARAADADKLDPSAAADAAKLTISSNPAEAHRWALQAVRRNPMSYANWRLAADTGLFNAWPDAYIYGWRFGSANIDEQIRLVKNAIDKHGRTSLLLARLAGLEFASGQYQTAADLLAQARVNDLRSPTLAVEQGNALWRAGDQKQAAQAWRQARSLAGSNHLYLADMSRAVELNPNDIRLRIDYAKLLCFAGQPGECLNQIDIAIWIESQLMKPSIQELTPAELAEVETLKARARSLMETATTTRS